MSLPTCQRGRRASQPTGDTPGPPTVHFGQVGRRAPLGHARGWLPARGTEARWDEERAPSRLPQTERGTFSGPRRLPRPPASGRRAEAGAQRCQKPGGAGARRGRPWQQGNPRAILALKRGPACRARPPLPDSPARPGTGAWTKVPGAHPPRAPALPRRPRPPAPAPPLGRAPAPRGRPRPLAGPGSARPATERQGRRPAPSLPCPAVLARARPAAAAIGQ